MNGFATMRNFTILLVSTVIALWAAYYVAGSEGSTEDPDMQATPASVGTPEPVQVLALAHPTSTLPSVI